MLAWPRAKRGIRGRRRYAELGTIQVYAERDLARAREIMREIG